MNGAPQKAAEELDMKIPENILEWIDSKQLHGCIRETLDSMDWNLPELTAYLTKNPENDPKSLLQLLIYAYSTGIFAAEDIAGRCCTPGPFKEIAHRMNPSAFELSRFRRENSGLLKMCVFHVLKWALFFHLKAGSSHCPSGIKKFIEIEARARLDLARCLDRALIEF